MSQCFGSRMTTAALQSNGEALSAASGDERSIGAIEIIMN